MSDVSRQVTGVYISCVKYPVWSPDKTTDHTLDVRCKYTCYWFTYIMCKVSCLGHLIKPQVIHLMSDVSRQVTGVYISCVKYPV